MTVPVTTNPATTDPATTLRLGYTIFYVRNVEQTLTFFTDAFGLERRFITPEGDYGELVTGPTTLSFVANELAHDNLDDAGGFAELDGSQPPVAASITLVTNDVEKVAAKAIDLGAANYVAATQKPWGQTVAYVRDPNGILIEIATPVAGADT